MTTHDLKIWPEYYIEVISKRKRFEIRNEYDRRFEPGDKLILNEFDPTGKGFTGKKCIADVLYCSRGLGIEKGFVCMTISNVREYFGNIDDRPDEASRSQV